jgi:hypothetical protein
VNDETTRLEARGARAKRDDQEADLLLKTYPNAILLFTHGESTKGKEALDLLQNQLLDYLMIENGRTASEKNRARSAGDIHE